MDYDSIFKAAIERLHDEGRYRVFIDILRTKGSFPNARCFAGHNGPKPITVWCSNDYLGMGQHPAVVEAMETALHDVGAGSGGTRNIGGNTHYHVELEAELAALHGKEAALLFTSGYVSNEAALSTLGKLLPGCVIFSDALNHASMIAGIRSSGCEKRVFRHNDLDHLEELLARGSGSAQADRLRERLFDGRRHRPDRGDLRPRRPLWRPHLSRRGPCRRHVRRAWRRHFRARRGRPPGDPDRGHARQGVRRDGRLYRGRPQTIVDCIRSYAPGFIFTTSLSPVLVAGALASVRHLKNRRPSARPSRQSAATLKAKFDAARPAADAERHAHRAAAGRLPGQGQADQRHPARRVRPLRPADQLPDRAARHRAAALHARPAPHRRDDGRADRRAGRNLGPAGDQARQAA